MNEGEQQTITVAWGPVEGAIGYTIQRSVPMSIPRQTPWYHLLWLKLRRQPLPVDWVERWVPVGTGSMD